MADDPETLRELKQTEQVQFLVALLQASAAIAALYLLLRKRKAKG